MKKLFLMVVIISGLNANAQWHQTNGPYGGYINSFAFSGSNIFTALDGGIFLSTNNGNSWSAVNNGLPDFAISSLIANDTTIFAGTAYGEGIYRSMNNGASWTAANNGFDTLNNDVTSFVISGSGIFAGTSNSGVFLSMDNGNSWAAVNGGLPIGLPTSVITALTANDTNIFAATNSSGVFLSTNNGSSWVAVNNGLTDMNMNTLAVCDSNIFAGTMNGLFRSANNGTSWVKADTGIFLPYIVSIAVSANNIFVCNANGHVYLSTNNGSNWTPVNNGLNFEPYTLAANANNIFAGTGEGSSATTLEGIFLSTNNGTNWTRISAGLIGSDVVSMATSGNNVFAGTWGEGVFLSSDNGMNWIESDSGLWDKLIFKLLINGNDLFAGTGNGLFLSTNNGTSWTCLDSGIIANVSSLAIMGSNIFAGSDYNGGIYLSTDHGVNWTAVNNGLTDLNVSSLTVSGANIFAGTDDMGGVGVYLSTDSGANWTPVNNGLVSTEISCMASIGNNIFAGTIGYGISLSVNNGTSWTSVNTGLTIDGQYVFSLLASGTILYAGTLDGVFFSSDYGTSWTAINNGLFNTYINALAVKGSHLFAGTYGGGVWEYDSCTAFYTMHPDIIPHNWIAVNLATGTPPITFSWNWGDSTSSTGTAPSHTYSTPGYYDICLTITDAIGCSDTYCDSSTYLFRPSGSNSIINVNVIDSSSVFLGISNEDETENGELNVYPNPATSKITIESKASDNNYWLYDITGKLLLTDKSASLIFEIDLSRFNSGIYFLTIGNNEKRIHRKIIKG